MDRRTAWILCAAVGLLLAGGFLYPAFCVLREAFVDPVDGGFTFGYVLAVLRDPLRGLYKKLVFKGNALVGACLYGDIRDGAWYFDLIRAGTSVAEQRDTLVFGPVQADAA